MLLTFPLRKIYKDKSHRPLVTNVSSPNEFLQKFNKAAAAGTKTPNKESC